MTAPNPQVAIVEVPGLPGPANTLTIGSVTSDLVASASITGSAPNQILNLVLPRGDAGPASDVSIGTVTTGPAGSLAGATLTGTPTNRLLNLTIPTGPSGPAPNLTVGTVTTGAAAVTITGTSPDYVLNFVLPSGSSGALPIGGVAGTWLKKNSATDYDASWAGITSADITDATSSGTASTVVKRDSSANTTVNQLTLSAAAPTATSHATRKDYVDSVGIPTGGGTNAILAKASGTNRDMQWMAASSTTAGVAMIRDGNGNTHINQLIIDALAPTSIDSATRKDYVDNQDLSMRRPAFPSIAADYTLALSDERKVVWTASATDVIVTVPPNTSSAFPVGTTIDFWQTNSGKITLAPGAGVTIRSPDNSLSTRGQYSVIRLIKTGSPDNWAVYGDTNNAIAQAISAAASSATNNAIVKRDSAGRAQVTDPSVNSDIATKNYIDNTAGTTANTASALVRRDSGGWITVGRVIIQSSPPTQSNEATRKDYVDGKTWLASSISDSTTVGRSVLTAVDATAARTAIGAGTSNLAIGTTSTTAKAGDYQPTSANISDSTATGRSLITAADAAAVRTISSAPFGNGITEIRLLTQAAYDAIGTKSATTLYVVQG